MDKFVGARFRLGWILIAVAALNSLVWTVVRWSYENSLTHAQITVDFDDTRQLADAYRIPQPQLLTSLRERGVTSLALYQQSLAKLRDTGRIAITPVEEAERLYPLTSWDLPPAYRWVITATPENQELLVQIREHLKDQAQPALPPRVVPLQAPAGQPQPANFAIAIPASYELLTDALMGYDPTQLAVVKAAGMVVTARIANPLNFSLQRLRTMLDEAQATGAHVVIFSEDEVLGYDSAIGTVADEMRRRHLLFGNIEFTKQRGWDDFSRRTDGMLVRVHSVGGDEAAKAKPEMLVDRYTRAVKERDIRVAYIRLIRQLKGEYAEPAAESGVATGTKAAADEQQLKSALEQNLDFVKKVSDELKQQPLPFAWLRPGLQMASAEGFGDYPIDWLAPRLHSMGKAKALRYLGCFLAGLGAVGGTLLLLNLFWDWGRRAQLLWLAVGVLLAAGLALSPGLGAKLMALQVGCIFPVIGMMWGGLPEFWSRSSSRRATEAGPEPTSGSAILTGTAILLKSTLVMMIGPILIIALLNQWKYFSGADKYLLPKATQLLPLIIVAMAYAAEMFPHRVLTEGAASARRRMKDQVNNALSQPFTARIALLSVVVAIAGYVWIARTGNDSGMEISTTELKMRSLLERVFITRPRTKEIFLGNPAMLFAAWFVLRRQWKAAVVAAILATIGQADMLNSFCHLHTPIFYAVLRTIHGVWLGAVVGAVALLAYVPVMKRLFPGGRGTTRVRAATDLDGAVVRSNGTARDAVHSPRP